MIDDNRQYVGLAVEDDSGEAVVPLKVDPITDRLLIEISDINPVGSPTVNSQPAKIDDNRIGTMLGITDDANEDTVLIPVDQNNGYLSIDLHIE